MPFKDSFTFGDFSISVGSLLSGVSERYEDFKTVLTRTNHVKMIKRIEWKVEHLPSKIVLIKTMIDLYRFQLQEAKPLVEKIIQDYDLKPEDEDLEGYSYLIHDPAKQEQRWFPAIFVHAIALYPDYFTQWKLIETTSSST